MDVVLTIIDTVSIQDYVFGSNRLRENVGASFLVELATRDWACKELVRLGRTNLEKTDENWRINRAATIEQNELVAEMIYMGGGNTVILFRTIDLARSFTQRLARRVLRHAPGLEIVIAHSNPFTWDPGGEGFLAHFEAFRDSRLAQKKRARTTAQLPMVGLGITEECPSTGAVATHPVRDPDSRLVSREVAAKVNGRLQKIAKRRLRNLLDLDESIEFSDDLDHLGRKSGEQSYIAVVHIDGNEVGQRIKHFVSRAKTNRQAIERMRDSSEVIEQSSTEAFKEMFAQLRPNQDMGLKEILPALRSSRFDKQAEPKYIPFYRDETGQKYDGKPCWPFRPLVLGGDDVTFVCNGQLGLSLTAIFVKAFAEHTASGFAALGTGESDPGSICSGAGIAIVKTHYPFRRAYDLSESLTRSAKRFLREKRKIGDSSALDWHVTSTGLSGSLETIHAREYSVPEGDLRMRPLWLANESDWRTWDNFNEIVAMFNYGEGFAGRRNKLMALRRALRVGKDAVKRFLSSYQLQLPELSNTNANMRESGWMGGQCGYFDALEALDHHFFLGRSDEDENEGRKMP